jgi:hypothetical protein
VAAKVIRENLTANDGALERFLRKPSTRPV